jgi:hypothetical protein
MWKKVELTVCNAKGDPIDTVSTMANCICDDCGQEINPYMMTDLAWEECAKTDEVLCFHCFSVRIDRPIFPSDFKECDINEPLLAWVKWFVFEQTKNQDTKSSGPMAPPG